MPPGRGREAPRVDKRAGSSIGWGRAGWRLRPALHRFLLESAERTLAGQSDSERRLVGRSERRLAGRTLVIEHIHVLFGGTPLGEWTPPLTGETGAADPRLASRQDTPIEEETSQHGVKVAWYKGVKRGGLRCGPAAAGRHQGLTRIDPVHHAHYKCPSPRPEVHGVADSDERRAPRPARRGLRWPPRA